jgi:hypothetical protein
VNASHTSAAIRVVGLNVFSATCIGQFARCRIVQHRNTISRALLQYPERNGKRLKRDWHSSVVVLAVRCFLRHVFSHTIPIWPSRTPKPQLFDSRKTTLSQVLAKLSQRLATM